MTGLAPETVIGRRLPKRNARPVVAGRGDYATDQWARGALTAAVLRSPHAHARILRVDISRARALHGVQAVVTAADVRNNLMGASVRHRPLFADDVVRCIGEPVAAVAAIDAATAQAALQLIGVDYEPLPSIHDIHGARAPDAPLIHADKSRFPHLPALDQWFVREVGNVSHRVVIRHGDVERALAGADRVHAQRFTTQPISQLCLEPHAAFAKWDRSGRLLMWCSTGKPFRVQGQICTALGLDSTQLKLEAPDVGGDFGNKGEVSIEAIVALLALKTRRPVKGVASRAEEFTGTGLVTPTVVDAKIGVMRDGRIVALELSFANDIGPYDGYGSMVTAWGAVCGAGPYEIPNVLICGESVHTNNLRAGSFRGFGNPQVSFARECILDIATKDLGLHPLEFRRLNGWRDGSISATGQRIDSALHGIGYVDTIDALASRFDDATVARGSATLRRGVGYASGVHGSGYGCLVDADTSGAIVKLQADGTLILFTGAYDVGQATTMALLQIVAEAMNVEPEQIALANQDTDSVPFDNGASASRQLYISGNASLRAAQALKGRILDLASRKLGVSPEALVIHKGVIRSRDPALTNQSLTLAQLAFYAIHACGEQPVGVGTWSLQGALLDKDGRGNPISAFLFATQRAEVEVDEETGAVRVLSLAGAHDVGRAINPLAVEGQIEGSLVQGMGYALLEEVRQNEGRPLNADLENYLAPMTADMPDLVAIIVESHEPTGPMGAKGVGEAGLVPTAPAIANAVESAIGVRITQLPITPERVLAALKARAAGERTGEGLAQTEKFGRSPS